MSATPLDSNNTSDPAQLRRSPESLQKQAIDAAADHTPPEEEEPPKRLSKSRRAETAPITIPGSSSSIDALWSSSRDAPQLTERDTIFATNYIQSRSPPAHETENSDNGNLLAKAEQSLGGPAAGKVKTPPRTSRKQTQVTFAESPETRYGNLEKAKTYDYEVHELLKDSPAGEPAAQATSMGVEGKQGDNSWREHPAPTQRPSSSPQDYNFSTIDEDERARYRSWRAGNAPWVGSGAGPKRRSRSGDNMHVDKNIEATLPKITQPATTARSRKSSQYLGLFKEKDVAEEKQKRDQRAKENAESVKEQDFAEDTGQTSARFTDSTSAGKFYEEPEPITPSTPTGTYEALSHGGPKVTKDVPPRLPRSNTDFSIDADKRARTSPVPIQKLPQSLSSRLVEEMKQRHDIELSSDSERLLSRSFTAKRADRSRVPSPKVRTPTEEYTEYIPRRESDESAGKSPLSDEDEGSEHEQIAKALYYPHRQLVAEDEEREPSPASLARVLENVKVTEGPLTPTTEQKLIDAERERVSNEVAISIETADETEHFHGQLSAVTSPPDEESYASSQDLSSTDYETADETSRSAFYDSSESDGTGTTPKASPKHISARKHHQPAPLGAVELMPYDHQVGGHSTVYRFSRRAICKQLNNRENIFYETVEREHPELVTFMPRYIGVLNVTYRKSSKRRKTTNATTPQDQTSPAATADASTKDDTKEKASAPETNGHAAPTPRIVSHSQQITPVPQVVLEHNRHIIPNSLFRNSSRPMTPRPQTSDPSLLSQMHRWQQNGDQLAPPEQVHSHSAEVSPSRPAMRQQPSWGATTVNTRLKEQVLREVFSAPPIHRHRRGRHHRSLSNTRSLLPESKEVAGSAPTSQNGDANRSKHASFEGTDSLRRSLLRGEHQRHERHGLTRTTSASMAGMSPPDSPALAPQRLDSQSGHASDDSVLSEARRSRRRHSGGGLMRRPYDIDSSKRSYLEFHEEEEGYGGDGEEEVFSMEDDTSVASSHNAAQSPPMQQETASTALDSQPSAPIALPTPPTDKQDGPVYGPVFEPINPKQAIADKDERVQLFILLEDLTAGMSKPCVLDLKMGTRQYGVEANQKKKRSQRQKCQNTTSQQLGVRVCGMQIFNVKTQSVVFKDKYYGRDLKAGREFQEALKGFFFDGYGYSAALKHIPLILEKISSLEAMIRELPGYRFYASSLLMLYDRAASDDPKSVEINGDKKSQHKLKEELKKKAEIKLKIVDFANCVTAEDPPPPEVPCPPHDPDGIDRGYLRGLRSLRLYFQRIWKELNEANFMERGDLDGMTIAQDSGAGHDYEDTSLASEDEGNVSF